MYLDEIVAAQKRGEPKGITSVCSAHREIIKQTLKVSRIFRVWPLIEATCNQVNQFGGYTGMTPEKFVDYVGDIAAENDFPFEKVILGGDHLGPNVWQGEPADIAMDKATMLVRDYVQAGFTKIHLDCSMRLANDPQGALDVEVSAKRAVQLAKVAEESAGEGLRFTLRYVIGTEVPIPGGATEHEDSILVTRVVDAQQTLEVTRAAFLREGLADAWEKVIGLVVQPGVEFGDDFVHPYQPQAARELSKFIENWPIIYEAHSTDYQTRDALKNLVQDQFAILKVGPALTFAFREAIFVLARIENELLPEGQRSNIMQVLEQVMLKQPKYWKKYYRGNEAEQAFKRNYSLSDRIRYYWAQPDVKHSLSRLMQNLGDEVLPYSLLSEFAGVTNLSATEIIEYMINKVLENYLGACGNSKD
jgi:D-tagatose-1,6-bisphosphate aldolase subunit GatZ/KbaZ